MFESYTIIASPFDALLAMSGFAGFTWNVGENFEGELRAWVIRCFEAVAPGCADRAVRSRKNLRIEAEDADRIGGLPSRVLIGRAVPRTGMIRGGGTKGWPLSRRCLLADLQWRREYSHRG